MYESAQCKREIYSATIFAYAENKVVSLKPLKGGFIKLAV